MVTHTVCIIFVGLYFIFITGARPNEAAYVALTHQVTKIPYDEIAKQYPYIIYMDDTKTGIKYEWPIHNRY